MKCYVLDRTGRITIVQGHVCERERARLLTSRQEWEMREDPISRINIALFNFKSKAQTQVRNKLREKNLFKISL